MLLWINRMQRTTAVKHTRTKCTSCYRHASKHLLGASGSCIYPVRSVLLIRTEQTLNKKEFVQELTEVVENCMYVCFQLPCFTEFCLKPPTTSIIMVYAILSVNTCLFFYTLISIS